MDYLRLVFGSLGVALFAMYMFVGIGPASDALYRAGLWPAYTIPEIQEAVSNSSPKAAVTCRAGENGWDYICDMVRSQAPLPPVRRKLGIASGASQPVLYLIEMGADEPTRPRPDRQRIPFGVSPLLVLLLFGAFATARVRRELGGGEISRRGIARLLARSRSQEP